MYQNKCKRRNKSQIGQVRLAVAEANTLPSPGEWFERSEMFEYLGQFLPTFLEKLLPEMV
jgi:hypothetical protein